MAERRAIGRQEVLDPVAVAAGSANVLAFGWPVLGVEAMCAQCGHESAVAS
jgi:hypothetical protein